MHDEAFQVAAQQLWWCAQLVHRNSKGRVCCIEDLKQKQAAGAIARGGTHEHRAKSVLWAPVNRSERPAGGGGGGGGGVLRQEKGKTHRLCSEVRALQLAGTVPESLL